MDIVGFGIMRALPLKKAETVLARIEVDNN